MKNTETSAAGEVRCIGLLAEALRSVLLLVDDGDLVRNTDGDGDMMTFLRQGMKITSALQKAQAALASANSEVSQHRPDDAMNTEMIISPETTAKAGSGGSESLSSIT